MSHIQNSCSLIPRAHPQIQMVSFRCMAILSPKNFETVHNRVLLRRQIGNVIIWEICTLHFKRPPKVISSVIVNPRPFMNGRGKDHKSLETIQRLLFIRRMKGTFDCL